MGKIQSIKLDQARIVLDDCSIRLIVKYKGVYCSEIKIWKLPKSGNLLSFLNNKNLYWAVYGETAKFLQGWYYQDDLMKLLSQKVERCANEADLKRLCLDLENILKKRESEI
jgi:hypothetical protein